MPKAYVVSRNPDGTWSVLCEGVVVSVLPTLSAASARVDLLTTRKDVPLPRADRRVPPARGPR
jgi:hypothetical protein